MSLQGNKRGCGGEGGREEQTGNSLGKPWLAHSRCSVNVEWLKVLTPTEPSESHALDWALH